MKLTRVRITEFQSIQDSTEFEIDDVTCLVGKNEAGKTALLKALYRLNPIVETAGDFDVTDDYPRRRVTNYKKAVEAGRQEPAQVVQATYALEPDDLTAVKEVFGPDSFIDKEPTVTLRKGYSNKRTFTDLKVNETETLKHLVKTANLPEQLASDLTKMKTAKEMMEALASSEQKGYSQELASMLKEISQNDCSYVIYNQILRGRLPKFLYFDEYYQMKGQDNLEALQQRVAKQTLETSDHPLLGLIELAGLDLNELSSLKRTEDLVAKLEAAENELTQKVLTYWSQNLHLQMKFDIRQARPEDPEGMRNGTNIWGRVHDTIHMVSTPLQTRSRGFVWFFSFLAWYSQLRGKGENIILLLDEPGLSLHAKAQEDLLRYFEKELRPYHQLIYSTHSPFMVDPAHFEHVRIVQDLSIESDFDKLPDEKQGTKVITEVLDATPDSLFPLQGALGYEIHQTLFVGPNCLVVEGVSDLLYIQTISALLEGDGREGLRTDWTITPVGGSDKVPTFVALLGAQKNLNIAVLIDYQKKDKQSIENLYKKKLLEKKKVLTYANFVKTNEADVEDMFDPEFYLNLVNGEFGTSLSVSDLPEGHPRIVRRVEQYFEQNPLPQSVEFNHYRPARYFSTKIGSLKSQLTQLQLDRFQKAFSALNKLL